MLRLFLKAMASPHTMLTKKCSDLLPATASRYYTKRSLTSHWQISKLLTQEESEKKDVALKIPLPTLSSQDFSLFKHDASVTKAVFDVFQKYFPRYSVKTLQMEAEQITLEGDACTDPVLSLLILSDHQLVKLKITSVDDDIDRVAVLGANAHAIGILAELGWPNYKKMASVLKQLGYSPLGKQAASTTNHKKTVSAEKNIEAVSYFPSIRNK